VLGVMAVIIAVTGNIFFISAQTTGDLYVTVWESNKAYNGTTLFADGHDPMNPRVVEVDMQGNVVWEWYLTNGIKQFTNHFYCGQVCHIA